MNLIAKVNMNEYRATAHRDICKTPQTTKVSAIEKITVSEEAQEI